MFANKSWIPTTFIELYVFYLSLVYKLLKLKSFFKHRKKSLHHPYFFNELSCNTKRAWAWDYNTGQEMMHVYACVRAVVCVCFHAYKHVCVIWLIYLVIQNNAYILLIVRFLYDLQIRNILGSWNTTFLCHHADLSSLFWRMTSKILIHTPSK